MHQRHHPAGSGSCRERACEAISRRVAGLHLARGIHCGERPHSRDEADRCSIPRNAWAIPNPFGISAHRQMLNFRPRRTPGTSHKIRGTALDQSRSGDRTGMIACAASHAARTRPEPRRRPQPLCVTAVLERPRRGSRDKAVSMTPEILQRPPGPR